MMTRKMGAMAKPVQEITVNGDTFNIKTTTTFKSSDITFTLGQEFDETTADGRKVKVISHVCEILECGVFQLVLPFLKRRLINTTLILCHKNC